MNQLQGWLVPPVFDDEEKTHQGYLLHVILLTLIIIPIPYILYVLIQTPEETNRALIQVIFSETINVFLLIMLMHGYVHQASLIQVVAFWLFFTATAATGSGVHSSAYLLGNGLVITIAGILLGGRGALATTLLAIISGGVMVYAELNGLFSPRVSDDALSLWIISILLFSIGASLQNLASREVRSALGRARISEERYRLISEVSSDYTFSADFDAQGNRTGFWAGGAFEKISGYTVEEYLKMGSWQSRLHPDDREQDMHDSLTLRRNQPVVSDIRLFRKSGELRWIRMYAKPIWNKTEDRLARVVGAVQDITNQKRSEEFEQRRRAMLEKVIRLGKRVTEVKDLRTTLERIWHGVHDELEFDRLAIFLYNPEKNSMDGSLGTNNEGQIVEEWNASFPVTKDDMFYRVIQKPDGYHFTHNYDIEEEVTAEDEMYGVKDFVAAAASAGDKPVAIIVADNLPSGRAITAEKLEALRLFAGYAGLAIENARLNSALQYELAQRQIFIEELEAKNAELERFTYTVSHDLKSPLVTITGFLGYLEKDAIAGDIGRVRSSVKRITVAAQKMQELLNNLLELSRIGRVINSPESLSFSEIIIESLERVKGQLDAKKIVVNVQPDLPSIYGDRVRLVEVVQNLIDNAAKFSDVDQNPRIEIGTIDTDQKGHATFFVRDHGIGIQPEYQERIFGLFNKLDHNAEGTGIGLTLVKRIIEVHGGEIWV
ncbi:MAG: ATP-binding protein, partial [Anaerolineales bacterium]